MIEQLVRKNIASLKPYSCARDEFKGEARVFVDANENPMNGPYNRYPDPLQWSIKEKIARLKSVRPQQIMLGNGSDEPIDLVIRIFCEPKEDNIVATTPTYGMYAVCANINNVEYREVKLNDDFSLDAEKLLAATDKNTKLIFLCSPNNPSGNLLNRSEILKVITGFSGIVIVDEAYIDFAGEASWLTDLDKYPNLVVLQTFSKAWGLAAIRCGLAFASEEIIGYFNKVKYPYNINKLTQDFIFGKLDSESEKNQWVNMLLAERARLAAKLSALPIVEHVYPSDANFLLVRIKDAPMAYSRLAAAGVVVRSRHNISLCENCLRITVGTAEENKIVIDEMKKID